MNFKLAYKSLEILIGNFVMSPEIPQEIFQISF